MSVLGLNRTFADLATTTQGFINDVRQARMSAVTRGAHYQLSWTTSNYTTVRLQDNDNNGVWQPDSQATPQAVTLPRGVTITTSSPQSIEFDTRGMVVPPAGATPGVVRVTISKAAAPSGTAKVEIWPSGQANPGS